VTDASNRLTLDGSIVEIAQLRYTPAGVPVVNFRIGHASEQIEAGHPRQVEVEMAAVALGQTAQLISGAKPGERAKFGGFIAAKSIKSKQPVLHVTEIEFLEGNENGIQTQG
jgi:primosomal replication protein N